MKDIEQYYMEWRSYYEECINQGFHGAEIMGSEEWVGYKKDIDMLALEQELTKAKALLSELRRLSDKYHAALAQEKLAPSQLNFEIASIKEEIANAVLKGLGE